MIYIVCEDSGSGFTFWGALNKAYLSSGASVIAAGGIGKMRREVEGLRLSKDDTVLLAIDNVSTNSVRSLVRVAQEMAVSCGFKLFCTAYYCFGEQFLSFSDIYKLGACNDSEVADILLVLQPYFRGDMAGVDYYKQDLAVLRAYRTRLALHNREKFAARLLLDITNNSRQRLRVTKGALGLCWYVDCCELTEKYGRYHCNLCIWSNSAGTCESKMKSFIHKSARIIQRMV